MITQLLIQGCVFFLQKEARKSSEIKAPELFLFRQRGKIHAGNRILPLQGHISPYLMFTPCL